MNNNIYKLNIDIVFKDEYQPGGKPVKFLLSMLDIDANKNNIYMTNEIKLTDKLINKTSSGADYLEFFTNKYDMGVLLENNRRKLISTKLKNANNNKKKIANLKILEQKNKKDNINLILKILFKQNTRIFPKGVGYDYYFINKFVWPCSNRALNNNQLVSSDRTAARRGSMPNIKFSNAHNNNTICVDIHLRHKDVDTKQHGCKFRRLGIRQQFDRFLYGKDASLIKYHNNKIHARLYGDELRSTASRPPSQSILKREEDAAFKALVRQRQLEEAAYAAAKLNPLSITQEKPSRSNTPVATVVEPPPSASVTSLKPKETEADKKSTAGGGKKKYTVKKKLRSKKSKSVKNKPRGKK